MTYGFNDNDKSKAYFKAIKAIYPINDLRIKVESAGRYTLSFYDSTRRIKLPEDADLTNCAVIVSASLYETKVSSEIIGDVDIGEYTFYGGYDEEDNFFRYPSIAYKASGVGWANFTGMVLLFE